MELLVKNKLFPFLLLILISFVFLIPLISNEFYLSHDGQAHVARLAAYYKAFTDGQFPLRWAGDLNYGYGSPVFIFYYPLPGILSIPFHAVGLSFEMVFKLLIAFFFGFSFVTFFFWAKEFAKIEAAFVGALLYGLAPYHFLNLYVRGDIAELAALAIAPLVFLFIKKCIESKSSGFIILASISYGLLILSHNAISLMFSPVIIAYVFLLSKDRKDILLGLAPIALGLLASAFFWIPALAESRYTNGKLFIGNMFRDHFPSLGQLIYSPWGFGPNVRASGGLSPQIGILNLIFATGSITLLSKKLKEKKLVLFWLGIFIIAIFFSLSLSSLFWSNIHLLKFFQFPWRMVSLVSFAASVLALYFFDRFINARTTVFLSILIMFFSIPFLKIQSIDSKNDSFYINYPGTTDYHGQASSIWTAGNFFKYPKAHYAIIEGEGEIIVKDRSSVHHSLNVDAQTHVKLVDNTVYFPGWQVMVDDKKTSIQFQDPNYRGLITFDVPRGKHNIKVSFGESPIRLISDYLSLVGLSIVVTFLIWGSRIDKVIKKL